MKEHYLILLFSLATITIPAFLIALGFLLYYHVFFAPFLVGIGIFCIIGTALNSYMQKKGIHQVETIKMKRAQEENSQNIEVSCAYCKVRSSVPIKLSDRNTYICPACDQENLVIFQFATAQITTPLVLSQYGDSNGLT